MACTTIRAIFLILALLFKIWSRRKMASLLLEIKQQLQVIQQQQQYMMDEIGKPRPAVRQTVKVPDGVMLPRQTFEQVAALERKLRQSPEDKQQLVGIAAVSQLVTALSRRFIFTNWIYTVDL